MKTFACSYVLFLLICCRALVVLEPHEFNYDTFRKKCINPQSVCVARKWADQYPKMRKVFTFDKLKRKCGHKRVSTNVYRPRSKQWANLAEGQEVILGDYIDGLLSGKTEQSVVFDEAVPTVCLPLMRKYVVPFMAVNDYVHRSITGRCDWFSGIDCEKNIEQRLSSYVPFIDHPSLFVQGKGTECGQHVDAFHSHFIQVLHVGKKEWRIQHDSNLETFLLEASDLVFVPANVSHAVANLEHSLATSINFIDGTNFKQSVEGGHLDQLDGDVLRWFSMLHRAEGKEDRLQQKDMSWKSWVAGSKADRFVSRNNDVL
eukprot:TRINITY_DN18195_c0_g1_i1.p1 TRINITY_DN18195_c0_g1~~TRINITY_DN18195_c0_g1_i1.p1  ORF type:complete len:316 (-),score=30.34 TRINITY_DN18195_c0_g1_i1:450-1397(-)